MGPVGRAWVRPATCIGHVHGSGRPRVWVTCMGQVGHVRGSRAWVRSATCMGHVHGSGRPRAWVRPATCMGQVTCTGAQACTFTVCSAVEREKMR
eukprot:359432-Chlamydomonas_euryale.AAC.4